VTATTTTTTTTAAVTPLSPGQVITLVRDARKKAFGDDDGRAPAEAGSGPGADPIKPGITIDLIAKNIPALPDEVVDILRNGVERLALSHNSLASLPARFSLCTSLRYFAARNNAFETFPLPASQPSPHSSSTQLTCQPSYAISPPSSSWISAGTDSGSFPQRSPS